MTSEDDPHGTPAGPVLLITARLLEDDDASPGFVAFEPEDAGRPIGEDRVASGWELYVGDESDDELEDAENARLVDVSWATERYPDLQVLLDEHDPATAAAWLATGDGDWVELDDELEDDLDDDLGDELEDPRGDGSEDLLGGATAPGSA